MQHLSDEEHKQSYQEPRKAINIQYWLISRRERAALCGRLSENPKTDGCMTLQKKKDETLYLVIQPLRCSCSAHILMHNVIMLTFHNVPTHARRWVPE